MYAEVVGDDRAGSTIHDDDHVVRQKFAVVAECEPRRASSPAAALRARGEHVVKRRRALGRPISKSRRPVRSRELTLVVVKTQVYNADHRRTIIRKVAAVRESGKFLVGSS